MSPELTALFLGAAFIVLVIASVIGFTSRSTWNGLVAAGLACWVLVPFWNAVEAL